MKVYLSVLFMIACVVLAPERVQAQVNEGDFRLGFDLSLVSFNSARIKGDAPAGDYDRKDNTLGAGTGAPLPGGAGVVLAYAATRHIVPGLYFSFQQISNKGEEEVGSVKREDPDRTVNQLEIRPHLELTLRPGTHFVPYGVLGLSYVRRASSNGNADTDSYGIGPVLGVGAHAFASSLVSIDFSLNFRALFVDDEDRENALEAAGIDDIKFRDYAVLFNVGVSFWL